MAMIKSEVSEARTSVMEYSLSNFASCGEGSQLGDHEGVMFE